jgi:hypothetical protein
LRNIEEGNGKLITRHTARGFPYQVWELPMPRIQDRVLDCVIYLYASKADAMAGENAGGSGFMVAIPFEDVPGAIFIYAITNKHVIEDGNGATCVRLNTLDGAMDAFEFKKEDWHTSKTDDLAVLMMPTIDKVFKVHAIPIECLISPDFVKVHDVGIGDEVLMIGRFINREGIQKNSPTARFGHIAQMPGDPIQIEINKKTFWQEEAFLIETRSIGGFSGSPVYLIPNKNYERRGKQLPTDTASLLGVDFCHITNGQPAKDMGGHHSENIFFDEHTGVAGVVPAWKLEALLNSDEEKAKRRASEKSTIAHRAAMQVAKTDSATALSAATTTDASDENPTHQEDFMTLVSAAARKQKQDD